jgi:transcriptional regulator with XRE-family HTH domain
LSQWSQRLDDYLAKKNISKKQLASQLGISDSTLQKWWGNREPSHEHAEKLRLFLTGNNNSPVAVPDKAVISEPSTPVQVHDKSEKRFGEGSVIVSLLRTTCPFCEAVIEQFRTCASCGQHFVWAHVPIEK